MGEPLGTSALPLGVRHRLRPAVAGIVVAAATLAIANAAVPQDTFAPPSSAALAAAAAVALPDGYPVLDSARIEQLTPADLLGRTSDDPAVGPLTAELRAEGLQRAVRVSATSTSTTGGLSMRVTSVVVTFATIATATGYARGSGRILRKDHEGCSAGEVRVATAMTSQLVCRGRRSVAIIAFVNLDEPPNDGHRADIERRLVQTLRAI